MGAGHNVNLIEENIKRKLAEKKFKNAYRTNQDILEKAPFGIYLINDKGNVDYVNSAMIEMSGDEHNQFIELNIFDLPTYQELGILQKIKDGLKGKYFRIEEVEYKSYLAHKTTIRNFIGIPLEEGEKKY
jgi:PAS domain-containing protein